MRVIEQQTVPHIYKERPWYPPKPGRMVGQSLTWGGFEPRTPGSVVSCLNHSAIPSGPVFGKGRDMETTAHSDFKCLIRKCLIALLEIGDISVHNKCLGASVVSLKILQTGHSLFTWKSFLITASLSNVGPSRSCQSRMSHPGVSNLSNVFTEGKLGFLKGITLK